MIKISRGGANLFAASILEDSIIYAETHQIEFAAFIDSTNSKKLEHEDLRNVERCYKKAMQLLIMLNTNAS